MKDVKKAAELLIKKGSAVFIASVDSDGFPNLKAILAPRKIVGLKTFFFATNTSSLRVAQYRAFPKAAIYFCNQQNFTCLMLRGTMEVLEDQKSKEMIWLGTDTQYYKGGVADPDYCVLKFTAGTGRQYQLFQSHDFTV